MKPAQIGPAPYESWSRGDTQAGQAVEASADRPCTAWKLEHGAAARALPISSTAMAASTVRSLAKNRPALISMPTVMKNRPMSRPL